MLQNNIFNYLNYKFYNNICNHIYFDQKNITNKPYNLKNLTILILLINVIKKFKMYTYSQYLI